MGAGTLLLGLFMPLLAAAGWLYWIYQSDKFDREPWGLVLLTALIGAGFGLLSLVLHLFVDHLGLLGGLAMIPVHLLALMATMYLLPYRNPNWNERFDGLVYGGAAGIGYGLLYTITPLFYDVALGYRLAAFSIPVYMLIGLILGNYLSHVKFGSPSRRAAHWWRGLMRAGLFLVGFEVSVALGGELVGGENLLAGLVAYGSNMIGWIFAVKAMEESNRNSPFNPDQYRLPLAVTACLHCGSRYPVDSAFCNSCGRSVVVPGEVR